MTRGAYLSAATSRLGAAGIPTARLDVLVLMEDVLNTNRAQILAEPDLLIPKGAHKQLNSLVSRRAKHIPLAYLRKSTEFYERDFYVDERVLEPRPESETMIELLLSADLPKSATIIDVGTGSGALAVTAKLALPTHSVMAIDNDRRCLEVARRNAGQHHANIEFVLSDLLANVRQSDLDGAVLLCNLPYVPDDFHINRAATHEPAVAIFGGEDGLDLYRRLFSQISSTVAKPSIVLTESLPPQHDQLKSIAQASDFRLFETIDFIQLFKTGTGSSGSKLRLNYL